MYLPRNILRVGESAWEQIESARRRREKVRVVSGMRDPVALSISIIVFMSDFYGHVSRPLSPRTVVSPDYVIASLQENWRWVLERREPGQTFEWLLWFLTDGFRNWFAGELGAAYGVDVLQGQFQGGGATNKHLRGEHSYLSPGGYAAGSARLCSLVGSSKHVSGNDAYVVSESEFQFPAALARALRGGTAPILAAGRHARRDLWRANRATLLPSR